MKMEFHLEIYLFNVDFANDVALIDGEEERLQF